MHIAFVVIFLKLVRSLKMTELRWKYVAQTEARASLKYSSVVTAAHFAIYITDTPLDVTPFAAHHCAPSG